jgi:hypothetical protein
VAPSIRKSWQSLHRHRRSLGRYSSLADSDHGVYFFLVAPLDSDTLLPTFVKLLEAFRYFCQFSRPFCSDVLDALETLSFQNTFSRGNRKKSGGDNAEEYLESSKAVTLRLEGHFLTTNDRCADVLPCVRNRLFRGHFASRFLLIASLRRPKNSMCLSLFTVLPSGINP